MTITWPVKTREFHNHHFDSTIWNDFRFRNNDIIIATYAKSGTTWMRQIVGQMLLGPDPGLAVADMSPWLDLRVPPKEVKLPMEAQTHRRFSEDPSAGRRARVLAKGKVPVHRTRCARRRVERLQSPRQRQRPRVPGAE